MAERILAGRRILVVEDEALVAMAMEDILTDAGGQVIGPVGSIEAALAVVADGGCDLATVDVNLAGAPAEPVAAALTEANIPFVLTSGYEPASVIRRFGQRPVLQKPFTANDLLTKLRQIMA